MAIDFGNERLLTFREASSLLPGRPHVSTFHRWRQRGIGGVRLETTRIGGKRFVTLSALQRFVSALSDPAASGQDEPHPLAKTQETSAARADAFLEKEGV